MKGKKRPLTERAHAVGIAVVSGIAEASRQTGIPEPTINAWFHSSEFEELRSRTKEQVAEEWWGIVQRGFRKTAELLDGTTDAQKAATATAIIADKMLLIRGEATVRNETRSLVDGFDDHEKRALRDAIDAQLDASGETARDPADAAVETASPT